MDSRRDHSEQATYQIRVKGLLDPCWSEWFDGLIIEPQTEGTSLLRGAVRDQAALHGLLTKIRDMGLPLLSVKRIDDPSTGRKK